MADKNMWCPKCLENTDHTTITEGRIHICGACGWETKFHKGEKGPAPREAKPAPYTPKAETDSENKTEETMKIKLTDEQKSDIRTRRAAGEKVSALEQEFGVSTQNIYMLCKGAKAPKKDRKATAPAKARPAAQVEAGGGLRQAMERMVAEAVDKRLAGLGLDSLDSKIEAAIMRALK